MRATSSRSWAAAIARKRFQRLSGAELLMSSKLCTVQNCKLPLAKEDKRLVCQRGHSFDIARSGYINLLQPQDKKSKHPGDTVAAVSGRRRLHDLGVTEPLLHAIAQMIGARPRDIVLDA